MKDEHPLFRQAFEIRREQRRAMLELTRANLHRSRRTERDWPATREFLRQRVYQRLAERRQQLEAQQRPLSLRRLYGEEGKLRRLRWWLWLAPAPLALRLRILGLAFVALCYRVLLFLVLSTAIALTVWLAFRLLLFLAGALISFWDG